jgi:hypothetical protein
LAFSVSPAKAVRSNYSIASCTVEASKKALVKRMVVRARAKKATALAKRVTALAKRVTVPAKRAALAKKVARVHARRAVDRCLADATMLAKRAAKVHAKRATAFAKRVTAPAKRAALAKRVMALAKKTVVRAHARRADVARCSAVLAKKAEKALAKKVTARARKALAKRARLARSRQPMKAQCFRLSTEEFVAKPSTTIEGFVLFLTNLNGDKLLDSGLYSMRT